MVKTIHLLKSQVGMPHDLAWGLVMVTQLLILQELLAGWAWGLFVVVNFMCANYRCTDEIT